VVGLTGGVFQNALLTELTAAALGRAGFEVAIHRLVPPNDGGLALGQAVSARSQLA
jgi:hydrogenase maturation protein HypF